MFDFLSTFLSKFTFLSTFMSAQFWLSGQRNLYAFLGGTSQKNTLYQYHATYSEMRRLPYSHTLMDLLARTLAAMLTNSSLLFLNTVSSFKKKKMNGETPEAIFQWWYMIVHGNAMAMVFLLQCTMGKMQWGDGNRNFHFWEKSWLFKGEMSLSLSK